MEQYFKEIAEKLSEWLGHAGAFLIAFFFTLLWLLSGLFFNFSDTWQLVMNTVTSVVTFLMVFIIQNTQNRNTRMMQIKLDELIRGYKSTRNSVINLNKLSDKELKKLEEEYLRMSKD